MVDEIYEDEFLTPGEEAAEAVGNLLQDAEFDPIRNRVGLDLFIRGKRDPISWFSKFDDLAIELTERIESGLVAKAPFDGGAPVYEIDVYDAVCERLDQLGVIEFFESATPPSDGMKIFTPDQYAKEQAGKIFRVDVADINHELIDYLAKNPSKMHDIVPRKFEELIAELFRAKGYNVELTPSSGDGGRDVICTQHNDFGMMLLLIECKKYSPDRPVGVDIVRALYGVMTSEKATKAMIATTSRFTKGARAFHEQNRFHLSLRDFDHVSGWLRDYKCK